MKGIWMNVLLVLFLAVGFTACDKDDDVVDPKDTSAKTLDAEVGGETQPNQVYVNLETGEQTVVNRDDWDLAFSSHISNAVVLNSSTGMLARSTGETDFAAVTSEDTVGMGSQFSLDAIFAALFAPDPPAWLVQTSGWYDDPSGDLGNTAIGEISSDAQVSEVFIINRGKTPDGAERGWKKIKVTMTGADSYALQFGDISDPAGQTVTMTKDADYNFVFFHFDDGKVVVEPPRDDWHVCFTVFTITQNFGFEIPYLINDYVILNRNSIFSHSKEFTGTVDIVAEFDAFTADSIGPGDLFNSNIDAIGSSWRTVANPQVPGSVTGVRMDRFYVLRDFEENEFKLLFTAMLSQGGERGFPRIRFAIL